MPEVLPNQDEALSRHFAICVATFYSLTDLNLEYGSQSSSRMKTFFLLLSTQTNEQATRLMERDDHGQQRRTFCNCVAGLLLWVFQEKGNTV